MKRLRFAIVGCGRIAARHAEQIAAKGDLAGVCDIDPQKADDLARRFKARAFYKVDDLLAEKDIDVVSVCTPNGLHAKHTIQSLKAGFHVLCEKPMAIRVADCREMIEAAEKTGKKLFIVKQNRFNPPVVAVKKALDEGRLGRIFSLQLNCYWNRKAEYYTGSPWKGTKELDGGALFTQFSHFIDLLYWMAGDVSEATAVAANYAHRGTVETEDTGIAILRFTNGAIAGINFTLNSYEKNMEGSLTIFGEKGTVKIGGQYLNTLEYQAIEGYMIGDLPKGSKSNQYGTYEGSMSNHDKVYDNVIDVLQHGGLMSAGAWDGLKTVEIIEKIYNAAIRL